MARWSFISSLSIGMSDHNEISETLCRICVQVVFCYAVLSGIRLILVRCQQIVEILTRDLGTLDTLSNGPVCSIQSRRARTEQVQHSSARHNEARTSQRGVSRRHKGWGRGDAQDHGHPRRPLKSSIVQLPWWERYCQPGRRLTEGFRPKPELSLCKGEIKPIPETRDTLSSHLPKTHSPYEKVADSVALRLIKNNDGLSDDGARAPSFDCLETRIDHDMVNRVGNVGDGWKDMTGNDTRNRSAGLGDAQKPRLCCHRRTTIEFERNADGDDVEEDLDGENSENDDSDIDADSPFVLDLNTAIDLDSSRYASGIRTSYLDCISDIDLRRDLERIFPDRGPDRNRTTEDVNPGTKPFSKPSEEATNRKVGFRGAAGMPDIDPEIAVECEEVLCRLDSCYQQILVVRVKLWDLEVEDAERNQAVLRKLASSRNELRNRQEELSNLKAHAFSFLGKVGEHRKELLDEIVDLIEGGDRIDRCFTDQLEWWGKIPGTLIEALDSR